MAEGIVEIEIDAPVKKVFDYVADVETHPIYDGHSVDDVRITSTKRRGKGVTFQQLRKGSDRYIDSEVLEFVQGRKIMWVAHSADNDVMVSYYFVPSRGGTKVTHTVSSPLLDDPKRLQASCEENEKELANLKRIMEDG